MKRGGRSACSLLLLGLGWVLAPSAGTAQSRPKTVECSFLLLSGCRNYAIEVQRVELGGRVHRQEDSDTYLAADPDTLDAALFYVLKLHQADGLEGQPAVIWVDRRAGAVGGDWPEMLRNDAIRSAELIGVPGDAVELYDDRRHRVDRGLTRLVIFAGESSCRTPTNLDTTGDAGRCAVLEGRTVAGKVSGIVIKYRGSGAAAAARDAAGARPDSIPAQPIAPDSVLPDSIPAPPIAPDSLLPDSIPNVPPAPESIPAAPVRPDSNPTASAQCSR